MWTEKFFISYIDECKLWYTYSNNINVSSDIYPILILFSDNWRKSTLLSPIGESPLYFRQHIPWSFANWRKSTVISPIRPLEFRQLAKVHCTFANRSVDFRDWRMSYWRKSYWRTSHYPEDTVVVVCCICFIVFSKNKNEFFFTFVFSVSVLIQHPIEIIIISFNE